MRFALKSRAIKLVDRVGYLVAALPFAGDYFYKFAKIIVRCHDNDANSDFYSNGEYRLLKYFIKKQLLKTVFDVGANIGEYSSIIADSKTKEGRVYVFDPRDSNIEILRKRFCGKDGVVVIPTALSDNNGSIDFYQSSDPSQSGTDSVYDMSTIGYFSKGQKSSVPCTTIDNFVGENHIGHISLMKPM